MIVYDINTFDAVSIRIAELDRRRVTEDACRFERRREVGAEVEGLRVALGGHGLFGEVHLHREPVRVFRVGQGD